MVLGGADMCRHLAGAVASCFKLMPPSHTPLSLSLLLCLSRQRPVFASQTGASCSQNVCEGNPSNIQWVGLCCTRLFAQCSGVGAGAAFHETANGGKKTDLGHSARLLLSLTLSLHFTSLHFTGDESAQADPGLGPPSPYNGGRGFGVICGRVCVLWYM